MKGDIIINNSTPLKHKTLDEIYPEIKEQIKKEILDKIDKVEFVGWTYTKHKIEQIIKGV